MSRWDALLEVQEHDTTTDQLKHRRKTLPARAELEKAMAGVAEIESRAANVAETRSGLLRSQKQIEDEVASLSEKAGAHDKLLYGGTIGNPRELQALQEEIGALKRRVSHLEDQQIELMEQIEPLDAELAKLSGERTALDEHAGSLRAQIAESEVEIDQRLTEVAAERDQLAAAIDPELLEEYEQLRPQLGGIAIARLVGGSCGGCHLALSAVEIDRIKKLPVEEPARCEECGRLLAR